MAMPKSKKKVGHPKKVEEENEQDVYVLSLIQLCVLIPKIVCICQGYGYTKV